MSEIGRDTKDYLDVKVLDSKISREDADLIIRFVNEKAGEIGHTTHTVLSNTRYLSHTVEHIPNIREWDNDKISEYVVKCRDRYKPNTIRKHILLTKQFCGWLVDKEINSNLDMVGISKTKSPPADMMTKTAAQMLSNDEIDKIIAAGSNTRDRCMLAMLAESGARPFEILDLKWEDLKFDEYGVIFNTAGKTGVPRFIRLIHSVPYIIGWRNDTPQKNGSAYVFVSLRKADAGHRITHSGLKKVVRIAAEKSGVRKRVFPYLFRHSSVTAMMSAGISDSTNRLVHWGSQKTAMLSTYAHIANPSVDNELLGAAGVVTAQNKAERKVHQCEGCKTILKPTDEFCPRCGKAQSETAKKHVKSEEERLSELIEKYLASKGK